MDGNKKKTILIFGFLVIFAFLFFYFTREQNVIVDYNLPDKYYTDAAARYGEFLSKKYKFSDVLIIVKYKYEDLTYQNLMVKGLKRFFIEKDIKVSIDHPFTFKSNDERDWKTKRVSAIDFDKVINRNSDCDMVISLMGLPSNFESMDLWKQDTANRPKIALLMHMTNIYYKFIKSQKIVAALDRNPETLHSGEKPKPMEKAFRYFFIIITSENIDELDKKFPFYKENEKEASARKKSQINFDKERNSSVYKW